MFCIGLQKLIDEKSLSRKEIAEVIGQSVSQVGMYVQGRRDPDTSILLKLSQHYNVSVDSLLMNDCVNDNNIEANEKNLIDSFLSLPKNIQQDILDLMQHISEAEQIYNENSENGKKTVKKEKNSMETFQLAADSGEREDVSYHMDEED